MERARARSVDGISRGGSVEAPDGHSAAVARYAREIALAMRRPPAEIELVHTSGLLHDIGKFAFPDAICSRVNS